MCNIDLQTIVIVNEWLLNNLLVDWWHTRYFSLIDMWHTCFLLFQFWLCLTFPLCIGKPGWLLCIEICRNTLSKIVMLKLLDRRIEYPAAHNWDLDIFCTLFKAIWYYLDLTAWLAKEIMETNSYYRRSCGTLYNV